MLLLSILFFIIWIVLMVLISKKFASIAEMKGHDGNEYFWYTFFFGIIGMLMVIALPQTKIKTEERRASAHYSKPIFTTKTSDNPTASPSHKWVCDNCGNMRTQTPCEYCGIE